MTNHVMCETLGPQVKTWVLQLGPANLWSSNNKNLFINPVYFVNSTHDVELVLSKLLTGAGNESGQKSALTCFHTFQLSRIAMYV
jgi:hypothetical protein